MNDFSVCISVFFSFFKPHVGTDERYPRRIVFLLSLGFLGVRGELTKVCLLALPCLSVSLHVITQNR